MQKKLCPTTRHPSEKKVYGSTDSPSLISYGTNEWKVLKCLFSQDQAASNIRQMSMDLGLARSTIYESLRRLEIKGMVAHKFLGSWTVTENGKDLLEAINTQNEGVGSSRRECRGRKNLSHHYGKYIIPNSDRTAFNLAKIKSVFNVDPETQHLDNMTNHYIHLEDATITIHDHKLTIHIHEILTEDTEEASLISFKKAVEYVKKLSLIGIVSKGMYIEKAHWERVNSYLAEFISKNIDERYFLDLGNGYKFWIDCSHDTRNDETNWEQARERFDQLMLDVINSDSRFSDIQQLKEIVSGLVKIHVIEIGKADSLIKYQSVGRPDYFG